MNRTTLRIGTATALAVALLATTAAVGVGQEAVTLRIASPAPRGSAWMRVYAAWANSVAEKTGGRLRLQIVPGTADGEARALAAMRAGRLDGVSLTPAGVGDVAPALLVLQAPGVADTYAKLDRVRGALDAPLRGVIDDAGLALMHWTDFGEERWLATRPIAKPDDLRGAKPWEPPDAPVARALHRVAGVQGVPMPLPQVLGALGSGRVGAVRATALAALNLQWHTRITHVTDRVDAIPSGATVLRKDRFEALPADLRQALVETAEQAGGLLRRQIRRDDATAYRNLVDRGVQVVDAGPHRAAWDALAERTRSALAGDVYPRPLLQRAERAAGR